VNSRIPIPSSLPKVTVRELRDLMGLWPPPDPFWLAYEASRIIGIAHGTSRNVVIRTEGEKGRQRQEKALRADTTFLTHDWT